MFGGGLIQIWAAGLRTPVAVSLAAVDRIVRALLPGTPLNGDLFVAKLQTSVCSRAPWICHARQAQTRHLPDA